VTFATQREVVAEERRERFENQPYQTAALELDALLFDWEPYARPVIGEEEDLEAASTADARAFGEQWYRPANATLAVAPPRPTTGPTSCSGCTR
jgi:zinc protease